VIETSEQPSSSTAETLVSIDEERELILDVLRSLGAPAANALTQARWLIEGDLRGHASHGVQRLPVIAERISRGLCDPGAVPAMAWASPAALVVDGRRGLGPAVGLSAVAALIERAPEQGVALGAVHNANHLGLLAPYVEECSAHGLIGIALTTSEALVHPWGGRIAQVGTNPIAVAVPTTTEPFIFDMATGVVSMGKVLAHRNRGQPLEPGWALDRAGDPTVDAAAASTGSIAPFGGAKGYGLGLAFELIVAALTGSALGRAVGGTLDITDLCNKGDVFICLDPGVFGDAGFAERVAGYLGDVRATKAQEGFDAVRVPGDRARSERERRLREGVLLPETVWRSLRELRDRVSNGAAL
jgi:L-2-hydroxycarboxylate dehydrogenase (NAD+)